MTLYNDPLFSYNAPINYNGVVIPPPVPVPGGGGGAISRFEPYPWVGGRLTTEEEEAVALLMAHLLED